MYKLSLPVLLLVFLTPCTIASENETPDLNSPYFQTLFQIGLEKHQTARFKELLNEYAQARRSGIRRERRHIRADLPIRIEHRRKKASERFVKQMAHLLDEQQLERFAAFHAELDKLLLEREDVEENNFPEDVFPDDT